MASVSLPAVSGELESLLSLRGQDLPNPRIGDPRNRPRTLFRSFLAFLTCVAAGETRSRRRPSAPGEGRRMGAAIR